jgi:DNA polymerase
MFIGEGPGFHEDRQGKPFVGPAGNFLDELLGYAGLKRSEVFITNVVKCRPPENRDPQPEELAACQRYLDAQIAAINPRIIVTLGRFSMARFIKDGKISRIHGYPHKVDSRIVVTMYHPAAALHQPALKDALIQDFSRLRDLMNQPTPRLMEQNYTESAESPTKENPPEQLSLF